MKVWRNRVLWFAGFASLPLFLAIPPFATAQEQRREEPPSPSKVKLGRVSGRVLREDNEQPLSKAIVTLIPTARPVEGVSARTDARGYFQFMEVVPGTYRLRAQRNGYITQTYGQRGNSPGINLTITADEVQEKVEFRLPRAAVITGTVSDEDAEPVEGLAVHAVRMRFSKGGRLDSSVVKTTHTDDAGDYRLAGLSPGYYFVQVGGRGNAVSLNLQAPPVTYGITFHPDADSTDRASRVHVNAGTVTRGIDVRVRSAATYTVSGVIVDSSQGGGPKRYSAGFAMKGGTATAQTQPDGSFAFHGVAPGDYTIVGVAAEDGGPTRRGFANIRVVASDVRVAIEIGRTAQLRGETRMESGRPFSLEGLRVSLSPSDPEAVSVATALEKDGSFHIRSVPFGSYRIALEGREENLYLSQVRCAGVDYTQNSIELLSSENPESCILTISDAVGAARGTLEADERHTIQDGMIVILIPQQRDLRLNPRRTIVAQSGKDGSFQLKGIIPGDYFAFSVAPMNDSAYFDLDFADRNLDQAKRITIRAGEPAQLNLKIVTPR